MNYCIECEMTNDFPCEKWGVCPFYDDDFLAKISEYQNKP